MRNTGLIVGAVAVLALAFVLLQGAGDEGAKTTAGVATTQETAAPAATTSAPATTEEAVDEPEPAPKPAPKPEIPTVTFEDGEPKGGVKSLEFEKGERVRFRVRSDVDEEIHVHGFDEYADVKAGGSVTIAFDAKFDGAFEVEMHDAAKQIASLAIQP